MNETPDLLAPNLLYEFTDSNKGLTDLQIWCRGRATQGWRTTEDGSNRYSSLPERAERARGTSATQRSLRETEHRERRSIWGQVYFHKW